MLETFLDYLRIGLYIGLAIIGFILFQSWQAENAQKTKLLNSHSTENSALVPSKSLSESSTVPTFHPADSNPHLAAPATNSETPQTVPENRFIHVRTDVLD